MLWWDSGLLHALLNVGDREALLNQPWVGASWEGFVVEQALTAFQHADRRWQAFHMRTSDQREIDLVVEVDGELWAFEAKLTSAPGPPDLAGLNANADLIGADRRFLVCQRCGLMEKDSQVVRDLESLIDYIEGR